MFSAIDPVFRHPLCSSNSPPFSALPLALYGFSTYICLYSTTWCSDLLVFELHTNVIILYSIFIDLVFPLNIVSKLHACSFICIVVHYSIVLIYHKLYLHLPVAIHLCFSKFCFVFSLGIKLL